MAFELPDLGYGYDALDKVIDAKTMEIHHGKHHGGYVSKLNTALEGYEDLQVKSVVELISDLDSLPVEISTAVRNNGGGHANHSLFWEVMKPGGGSAPVGDSAEAIEKEFGSLEKMKAEFESAALGQFGSGWAWLTIEKGKLHVCSTPNQDSPWMEGNVPILGLDVWEHAYYLRYQNMRADYVSAWWSLVNWDEVERRFEEAMGSRT